MNEEELKQRDFLRALDPHRTDMVAHAVEVIGELQNGRCPVCGGPVERQGGGDWYHFLEEDAETCTAHEYGGRA